MSSVDAKPGISLGFLTVVEHAQYGLFGGYLVLNAAGRPLEFHCTTPIKPNRAQQILYGATLEPYLFGEQIGQTLLAKSKRDPLVVCTDREPALAVRDFTDVPVVLVLPGEETLGGADGAPGTPATQGQNWRIDQPQPARPCLATFALGRNRLAIPALADDDYRRVSERLGSLAESFDLAEPFVRIREAIEEARRGAQ